METRREFIQKAAVLASGAGLAGMLPASIQKAMAINPKEGSTYMDAEHVVILMQENRSFDHCFGTLQGVRGFNDPRAITLPNRNKVWLQSNKEGETFAPFRLNLKDSNATWMSSLPHSWENQVDARNNGKFDKWLDVKKSGNREYKKMPLTLGYYNREDIPFYYALADAFTVCDQNFCSSLTGTTPNRLYLWSGTIREKPEESSMANVKNEDVDYEKWAKWKTFPERLEENNVSWKIYQNEISLPTGLSGDEDAWLSNFTDNPIEWFEKYNVKFSPEYHTYLKAQLIALPEEIKELNLKLKTLPADSPELEKTKKLIARKEHYLVIAKEDVVKWAPEKFEKLSEFEKNIHRKAFTTNKKDVDYHSLTSLSYDDNGTKREVSVPKGDVLYQFREDVSKGNLPTVSWLVAPENFSDHPGAPWYGAWYLSETLDILTKNPEVWKKTIFILAYDENDGYFDHVPPFVAPHPNDRYAGKVSKGIDAAAEQVSLAQELKRPHDNPEKDARSGPIGLGFRVPLLIASPWSRGGNVCSEVFDHTSVIQFLEKFTSKKSGKKIKETNITEWRRTICGDLSSVFKPYNGEKINLPEFVQKNPFIESVHKAKFKELPSNYKKLSAEEITSVNKDAEYSPLLPKQEAGVRPACALPYQLYAEGNLSEDKSAFEISFTASNEVFGTKAEGSPFIVYAPEKFASRDKEGNVTGFEDVNVRNYAVSKGDSLKDSWALKDFGQQDYHLRVYGPNGFFREFTGNADEPNIEVKCEYQRSDVNAKKLTGNVSLKITNSEVNPVTVEIIDNSYKTGSQVKELGGAGSMQASIEVNLNLSKSYNWYDLSVKVKGNSSFEKRYAGHVETGKQGFTDPLMGRINL